MPIIILIDKSGTIKETSLKQYIEGDLYKKAGFKTADSFKLHTTWNVELGTKKYSISLYGKTDGKANQENKYDFPPPVDKDLFFGSCILVNKNENGEALNISESEWEQLYEKLFGGFEDIGSSDSEEEDEYDGPTTKEGYTKDGFVVDDDESCDYDESDSDTSEPEIKSKNTIKKQPIKETVFLENDYLDCKSELSEEEYFE